jgi:hypothetical protein
MVVNSSRTTCIGALRMIIVRCLGLKWVVVIIDRRTFAMFSLVDFGVYWLVLLNESIPVW